MEYPNKFQAGDVVIARYTIKFCDGSRHVIGQRITICDKELSYFNVNAQDYYLAEQSE